jgi:hypothetical protein
MASHPIATAEQHAHERRALEPDRRVGYAFEVAGVDAFRVGVEQVLDLARVVGHGRNLAHSSKAPAAMGTCRSRPSVLRGRPTREAR